MEDLNFRRNVEPDKRRKNNKSLHELSELQAEYKASKKVVDIADGKLQKEDDKLNKATILLEDTRNALSEVQAEIDADYLPEGAQPRDRIQRRDSLLMQEEQYEAALEVQRKYTQNAHETFLEAERRLFTADKTLNRFAETLEDVVLAKKTIAALDKEKLDRVKKIEARAAKQKEKSAQLAKEAKEAQLREMQEISRQNLETTKKLNKTARKKVADSAVVARQQEDVEKQKKEDRLQSRFKAVYELKTSTDMVNAELAGLAAKHVASVKAAEKRLEDEKEALLSKGLNPYVEFRKKELNAEARHREHRLKEAVTHNKKELAEKLDKENKFIKKQERAEQLARQYEQEHRASQGRTVVEEKNHNYILDQTSGEMEILDPLGKAARVYPSQIVGPAEMGTINRHSTGVKRITQLMRASIASEEDGRSGVERGSVGAGGIGDGDGGGELGNAASSRDEASVPGIPGVGAGAAGAGGAGGGTQSSALDKKTLAMSAAVAALGGEMDSSAGGSMVLGPGMTARDLSILETLATQPGAMPGADKTAIELNLNGDDIEKKELLKLTVEEEGQLGNASELMNFSSPKYKIRNLTQFDRDSLQRAKDRHQSRIEDGVEQIAGGRTFHGPSFVSTPAELTFVDFEVGKKYKKRFTLTNVSYTFNSFKYLDLDESVSDFFLVTFDKPGRMSAGMSCPLDIEFTPKVNADIFTHLKFFTQTGPVEIPLRCLIRRCAPRILNPDIDFGNMVMGQSQTMPIKIHNTQAISTRFSIFPLNPPAEGDSGEDRDAAVATSTKSGEGGRGGGSARENAEGPAQEDAEGTGVELDDMGDHIGTEPALNEAELSTRVRRVMTEVLRSKQRETPQPLSCKVVEGTLPGYGSTTVDVLCAPLTLGNIEQTFVIVFEDVHEVMETVDDVGELVRREQQVVARVVGEEVPIYVAEETMDLRCTLHDRIYRKKLTVRNRGKAAYRVMVNVAALFRDAVEVNPTMFFVQSKSSQSVNIKFTPTADMLTKVAHFTLPCEDFQQAALTSLPIEIQAVNQEIPAYFILTSNVCRSQLELSTSVLEFGKVYIGQKSTRKITITNSSMLPQKMAFVRLRKEFLVQPNDGFALLLPNESMEFEISFGPQSAINYEVFVTVLTSFNDTYSIKVIAEGVDPPLSFSSSVVQMRTTYPGERVLENVVVTNQSRHTQTFQVMLPHKLFTWLTVSPEVMELAAGESGRLEVEFCPPAEAKEVVDPRAWHAEVLEQASPAASPFDDWTPDSGWVFGRGTYGHVQWVQEGARSAEYEAIAAAEAEAAAIAAAAEAEEAAAANAAGGGEEDEGKEDTQPASAEGDGGGLEEEDGDSLGAEEEEEFEGGGGATASQGSVGKDPQDLVEEEWGIFSRWNLPVLVRPRKKHHNATLDGDAAAATTGTMALTATHKGGGKAKAAAAAVPSPLFLSIECAVTLPQLESDAKTMDFGQVSVGTRLIKSFKIFNRGLEAIKLKSIGFNAVGPFTLIRPIKEIGAGENLTVLVECLPARPGLNVEVLEICPEDPERGGHRITMTFKVQGLMPAVELDGLSPPPSIWNPRCGIMDFGHCLAQDYVTRRFTVHNRSTFAVNAIIARVPSFKLNPNQQAEMVERTASGLPVFTIRPQNVVIQEGESEEIEVTFRPDRGRFRPFREDIDLMIGETDEILRIGIFGRAWDRQIIVVPDDPRDEPFSRPAFEGTSAVEDTLLVHGSSDVRSAAKEARGNLQLAFPDSPMITLEYPDPFAPEVPPSSYIEMDSAADGGKGGGGKGGKGAAAVAIPPGARQQTKRLVLCSTGVSDGRPGVGAGTFEIVLSEAAVASNLFALSLDKGAITVDGKVTVDISCTVPKPRSLGGIFVGSWQSYPAEVVLNGGWKPEGMPDQQRVPITLKAYVSL